MSCPEELRASPLFRDVPEEAVRDAGSVVVPRLYRRGDLIVVQDDQGEALHLLTRGVVRVSRMGVGGRERVLGDVYAPGLVGETAVLAGGSRSATVRALGEVRALMLHREHFELILRRHPRVLWNLAEMLARRVTLLNDELIALSLNTTAALAHVLLGQYTARQQAGVGQPERVPLGTGDLMLRLGSSRETVHRALDTLQERGLVAVEGHDLVLLDPAALEDVSFEAADRSGA